jgi:hypothetical protein
LQSPAIGGVLEVCAIAPNNPPNPKITLGPFKLTYVDDRFEEIVRIAHCEACGNIVLRKVEKEKPKPHAAPSQES